MNKISDTQYGISEYDLSNHLCKEFNIELKEEEFYLKHFKNFAVRKMDGALHVEGREDIGYLDGFDTDDGEFLFLDEIDIEMKKSDKLYLLTSKSPKSLNSQFSREKNVYLHGSLGFIEDELVVISSVDGKVELKVKFDNNLRKDCILIYSGTKGLNNLTTSKHSYDGKCAIYQENRVVISKVLI